LINVNLLGSLSINFTLLPYFEHEKRGTVIHIGSTAATHAIGSVGYNMSKAALNAYVRSAGNHFVKSNVLICGINPGAFHASRNAMERLKINKPDQYELFLNRRIPRKEMMSSSEIISVIKFIAQSGSLALAGSMIPLDVGESLAY
jgi:NAD(P)-dependent dehydrogenase (short-subunit alcohol dehydrogenase family)